MSLVTGLGQAISFAVGKPLESITYEKKRWFIVAGLIGGLSAGLFFASRALITQSEAFALLSICTYAFMHFAADTAFVINSFAKWLLNHGGEKGHRYLQSIRPT